jgi:hypothetical protein
MAGKKPDFDVFTSRDGADNKAHYTRIGAAWHVAKGGISIKLDALPIADSIVLFPPKEKE